MSTPYDAGVTCSILVEHVFATKHVPLQALVPRTPRAEMAPEHVHLIHHPRDAGKRRPRHDRAYILMWPNPRQGQMRSERTLLRRHPRPLGRLLDDPCEAIEPHQAIRESYPQNRRLGRGRKGTQCPERSSEWLAEVDFVERSEEPLICELVRVANESQSQMPVLRPHDAPRERPVEECSEGMARLIEKRNRDEQPAYHHVPVMPSRKRWSAAVDAYVRTRSLSPGSRIVRARVSAGVCTPMIIVPDGRSRGSGPADPVTETATSAPSCSAAPSAIAGNIRRKDLQELFTDPRKTLAMRFPQLDLGSAYPRGFLEESTANETGSDDTSKFIPKLMIGGRLPHFWLLKPGGKSTEKFSSLDLAATAAEKDGRPFHVLLTSGIAQQRVNDLAIRLQNRFYPFKKIYFSGNDALSDETVFAFAGDTPAFLPTRFAVLVRPDGHVAWMETG